MSAFQLATTFLLVALLAAVVRRLGSRWPTIVAHATFKTIGLPLTSFAYGSGGFG